MDRHGTTCLPVSDGPTSQEAAWWNEDRGEACSAQTLEQALREEPRWDLIQRIRREIASGLYETPEKWDVAVERLADQFHMR
jgi:hypothetical protein